MSYESTADFADGLEDQRHDDERGPELREKVSEVDVQPDRWWRRRWVWIVGSSFLILIAAGVATVEWGLRQLQPRLRQKVIETLEARFHSPVELDRLEISMTKGILVTGGGLRILYLSGPTKPSVRPNAPPMLMVDHFEFRTGWRELLQPTTRVVSVKVNGLQVTIPPKEERLETQLENPKKERQPVIGLLVDTIECTDAKVVIETNRPDKQPLEFLISKMVLKDVGLTKPFNYEATLRNPKPAGDIHSTGHFGPWNRAEPRDTPLDGIYEFTHVDLAMIHGIAGTLSSTGKFSGTLGEIAVNGTAEVPAFRLDVSDHALPLHTVFDAVVDGTSGDTILNSVKARVGRSELTASGTVMRSTTSVHGHNIDLHLVMDNARVEDMISLAMKGSPTLLRGALATKTHLEIPPGPVSVSRKMRLDGTFAIRDAFLNNAKMQQQLDSMSERAKGNPDKANAQEAEVVGSSLKGKFRQANALLDVSELEFAMPGAQILLDGQVKVVESLFEFQGKVRTQATASQMTGGWKGLLLKPFDSLLKKNGAGMEIPIKVTGTRSTYDLRLNYPHDAHAPPALTSGAK